jgi:hypothetical protein
VDVNAFFWIDVASAAGLAVWFIARHPTIGPKSLGPALVVFAVGQFFPSLGLVVVRPALAQPHGVELALVGIALPAFVVMFVTTGWLMRACASPSPDTHGGHRVRHLSRFRV